MKTRFLFRMMRAFPLAVTALLCTQSVVAQRITDVYLAQGRTNYASPTCPATSQMNLVWKIISDGPVGNVTYQLVHSDETVLNAIDSVVIDRAGPVLVSSDFTRTWSGRWQDTVTLNILTPVRMSSPPIRLTGSCGELPQLVNQTYESLRTRPTVASVSTPAKILRTPPTVTSVSTPAEIIVTPVAHGRFRVTLTGFRVNNATTDDPLELDGPGDEVYALAEVAELYPLSGIVGERQSHQTFQYGDSRRRNRLAGSATSEGGLRTGDYFPTTGDHTTRYDSQPNDHSRNAQFPTILWEGVLSSRTNAVAILPMIWEIDDNTMMRDVWNSQVSSWFRHFASNAGPSISGSATRPLITRADAILHRTPTRFDFDRPIGMEGENFNPLSAAPAEATFRPAVMFLTYDSAQEAAASYTNSSIGGRGIIEVRYHDGEGYGPGDYTIYLVIERLPDPR